MLVSTTVASAYHGAVMHVRYSPCDAHVMYSCIAVSADLCDDGAFRDALGPSYPVLSVLLYHTESLWPIRGSLEVECHPVKL